MIEESIGVPEAELKETSLGLVPEGEGWFVLNARDATWVRSEERGQDTDFEARQEWTQLGFRIQVLGPGQRSLYHGERGQEDFLVVSGECVLVIEGEERLRNTPGLRSIKAQLALLAPGQRISQRLPIGDLNIIRTAPRERFVDFYEAYYRPERATFVAVGDFDVDVMERKIRAAFEG